MDILNPVDIVDIISIKTWQDLINKQDQNFIPCNKDSIFKYSPQINNKLVLWTGSIYKLKCDAIVIPINNFIEGKLSIESSTIYKLAGINYARSFVNTVLGCKTSEIRVTEGYELPCHQVFHTVCPRYNPKYETAAINALYNCYRNSLVAAIDKNAKNIGFATLHLSKHSFPNEIALHIAARTIRRFLEKYSEYIDIIVLNMPIELMSIYNQIFPIYFPRNSTEENYSALNIPDDIGNEDGQPIQPNREIRISAFPYGPRMNSYETDESADENGPGKSNIDYTSQTKRYISQTQVAPAVIRQSISVKYQGKVGEALKNYEENVSLERKFERLFRCSKKMNMSHLKELRAFYQCGKDLQDQPIFLVVEKNIPNDVDNRRNEILAFIIDTLEKSIKGKHFSIIYAHTQSLFNPSRDFVMEIYNILKMRYQRFLRCLCMVHPTLYNRGINWIFSTFFAPELKEKLFNVTNLRQLYRIINPSILELPDFIYQYDRQVGGANKHNDSVDQSNLTGPSKIQGLTMATEVHEDL